MKNLLKRESGFTLIEIVVVLAIAALILVIVIAAVGGAQRQRRDTARVQAVGNLAAAMESYASNNAGSYPSPAGTALPASYLTNVSDPSGIAPAATAGNAAGVAATAGAPIQYTSNAICGGTAGTAGSYTSTGATSRNWAISYWSEVGTAASCRSNQ